MKAAQIRSFGDTDQLEVVEIPVPGIGHGEVLIRVGAAGLNPKDVLVRKGKFRRLTGSKFPMGVGFEFSGVVEATRASEFQPGQEVFGMINGWQGRCCAGYVAVAAGELARSPQNFPALEVAGIPLAGQTALQALRDKGKLQPGQRVLINGASGGVGTLAIQIANAFGGEVTAVSGTANVERCASLGAHRAISYEATELTTLQEEFDLFFDVFGNYSFQTIAHLLKPGGRYVTTVPKPAIFVEQLKNVFRRKKALMVVVRSNTADLEWLRDHLETGQLQPVVDSTYPLGEVVEAQLRIASKRARGKVIVDLG